MIQKDTLLDFSFPKTLRLRTRRHYQQMVQPSTLKFMGRFVIVEMRAGKKPVSRLGITVTKRFGKAHERNRFKRRVKEAFRLARALFSQDFDVLVKPRSAAKEASMHSIQSELMRAVEWAAPKLVVCA